MKVAIVHDWLTNLGGAERVVYALHQLYPEAPIYTSVYKKSALPMFDDADVRTTWMQHLPFLRYKHQVWSWLRPFAFRGLDLSEFDVIITSSTAESKNVRVKPGVLHICYCHTPTRYFWSHYDNYKKDPGLGPLNGLARFVMPAMVTILRRIDLKAAARVTYFVANSNEVKKRIKTYYGRESVVIFPPVETERFTAPKSTKRQGFVIAGRQIPYKKFDLAIKACNELKLPLTVIGIGPEHDNLVAMAGDTINFETDVSDVDMPKFFQSAQAFIFPAEEDFGIVPIEAMAAGCPVIAYKKAGALDYITNDSGMFFDKQTVASLKKALQAFPKTKFSPAKIAKHAQQFDEERFKLEMNELVRTLAEVRVD